MKAIYQHALWTIRHDETMTQCGEAGELRIPVPYGSQDLIIDPTDSQIEDLVKEPGERPAPDSSNLYVKLFHGRNHPGDDLDDWGFAGPVIGPVGLSFTYGSVKLHAPGWGGDLQHIPQAGGCYALEGKYYGDIEVWTENDPKLPVAIRETRLIGFAEFSRLADQQVEADRERQDNEPTAT